MQMLKYKYKSIYIIKILKVKQHICSKTYLQKQYLIVNTYVIWIFFYLSIYSNYKTYYIVTKEDNHFL